MPEHEVMNKSPSAVKMELWLPCWGVNVTPLTHVIC